MTGYSVRHVRAHLGRVGDIERKAVIESDPVYIALLRRASPGERVMRVWISSTFRDMQRERDYLLRFTFPQLREICELSDVTFVEVDLRWGITEKEVANDQVLEIVLSEIDRCRPYFVGLVGERYGWIPASIPESTLARYAWLKQFQGCSTLEIEALHAVLREDTAPSEALFYFRDPSISASIEAQQGLDRAEENAHAKTQLARLKHQVRTAASQGRCSLRDNFQTPEELGEWVLRDLTAKIKPQQALHTLDVESARHLTFAKRNVQTYLQRRGHFEQLDAALLSDGKPLLVTGAVGIGKSALLANWALQRQESHRIEIVITHFAGSVPDSTDPIRATRRIMHELRRSCYLSMEVPEAADDVRRRFRDFLSAAKEGERLIFVVDGLESFEGLEEAIDLDWLLDMSAVSCGVIASSSDTRIAQALLKRGWSEFPLLDLTISEREELIASFLSSYSRRLGSHQVERIVSAPQAGNPLYLTSLLGELRVVGSFERLDLMIDHHLGAASVPALFEQILERLESDFGQEFVNQSLALVWKSPRGLSEEEILDFADRAGIAVSAGAWKQLARAARALLLETAGRFRIYHPAWRTAVRHRYCGLTGDDPI
jgi:hypothetical protein